MLLCWYFSTICIRLVQVNFFSLFNSPTVLSSSLFGYTKPMIQKRFCALLSASSYQFSSSELFVILLQKVDYPLVLDVYDLCSDDLRKRLEVPRRVQAVLHSF